MNNNFILIGELENQIAEKNKLYDISATSLRAALTRIEKQEKAIKRTLQYLRQPDDTEAEFIERLLDEAIK